MRFIVWFHYFIINLMTYHELPRFIKSGGYEWFNLIAKCYSVDCNWHISYTRNTDNGVSHLLYVSSKYKYIAYMKMVFVLWRNRSDISYSVDYL